MESSKNLWPEFGNESVITPAYILKEQAAKLGERTGNIVLARVSTKPFDFSRQSQVPLKRDGFKHDFYIVAPVLGDYSYRLFSAYHELIDVFPVYINSHKEKPVEVLYLSDYVEANNQQEFIAELKNIFADPKTVKIIQTLLAQSK